jgi:hypothetical protein
LVAVGGVRLEEAVEVGARERGDDAVVEGARLRRARYAPSSSGKLAEQRPRGISAMRPLTGVPLAADQHAPVRTM